jgi:hypothetical protein
VWLKSSGYFVHLEEFWPAEKTLLQDTADPRELFQVTRK